MTETGLTYVCAHCGAFVETPNIQVYSGKVLRCEKCNKVTILDLSTPKERIAKYKLAHEVHSYAVTERT